MLYLDGKSPEAVENILKFLEWRAVVWESESNRKTSKREQAACAAASKAVRAVAEDIRAAIDNSAKMGMPSSFAQSGPA